MLKGIGKSQKKNKKIHGVTNGRMAGHTGSKPIVPSDETGRGLITAQYINIVTHPGFEFRHEGKRSSSSRTPSPEATGRE